MITLCFFSLAYSIYTANTIPLISAHTGKRYEQVVHDSSFPIKSKTVIYPGEKPEPDSIWIRSPVIIKFDDPQHGFTLPPTRFGVVAFNEWKVTTLTTSPMLEALPFEQLIPLLDDLQATLKTAGWTPHYADRGGWLNTESEVARNALQRVLFDKIETVTLLIPDKYMLFLTVICAPRCDERAPEKARYLIDISLGKDFTKPGPH
ncbi:hypothetical protein ACW9H6_16835 [Pseudomonas sp. SDO528_S397]